MAHARVVVINPNDLTPVAARARNITYTVRIVRQNTVVVVTTVLCTDEHSVNIYNSLCYNNIMYHNVSYTSRELAESIERRRGANNITSC